MNEAQILSWVEGPLRDFFPFQRFLGGYGRLSGGRIRMQNLVTSGHQAEFIASLEDAFNLAARGCFAWWVQNRAAFILDPSCPPPFATERELEEINALAAVAFLILERVAPGRELPNAPGWYGRALIVAMFQVGITLSTSKLWTQLFGNASLFDLDALRLPLLEGFIGWLVGTFFFYWWHRIRHMNGWWVLFHQVHHSPARIEAITSFYKHPVEILADSAVAAAVLYPLLGCSLEGAMWFTVFAATGEFFYHSNYKSPPWLKYFIQTPELHSLHHELDVHTGNFGDLPIWDRLFGTYRDADDFAAQCGFPRHNERHLSRMLLFQDVYDRRS